jgi:L-cysteine desulfidase
MKERIISLVAPIHGHVCDGCAEEIAMKIATDRHNDEMIKRQEFLNKINKRIVKADIVWEDEFVDDKCCNCETWECMKNEHNGND